MSAALKLCTVDGCEKPQASRKLCHMHYRRLRMWGSTEDRPLVVPKRGPTDPEPRFLKSVKWVAPSDFAPELGPCLMWLGADNGNGYGQFAWGGRRNGYAHRYAWEREHGEIPAGLTVDHLCRVRRCVNVSHLELVTGRENTQRAARIRTHCAKGHEYTSDNVVYKSNGRRACKTCKVETSRRCDDKKTNKVRGLPDNRLKYDPVLRDELATSVVEGAMTLNEASRRLGCSSKYMDKCARLVRRGERTAAKKRPAKRIPTKVREALHERANSMCEMCSKPANNAHHRRNQSQGGLDVLSNLMLLCGSGVHGCHGWVTHNPEMSTRNGWTIQGEMDVPSETPVRRRGVLVLLADNGDVIPRTPELKAVP